MKTLIGLIIFEVFAFFAVLFFLNTKKNEVPTYEADVHNIARVNDSLVNNLNNNIARLDSFLNESKAMRTKVEILTKQK